jgi:predicted permease
MIWRRKRMPGALDLDIEEHIQRETADNIDRGMPAEEARYAALRKFGNISQIKEETRNVWVSVWLEQAIQDLRYAAGMLRRNPGFCVAAVLTLALGIGMNTAIFSVFDGVVLAPLPYNQPDRLVLVLLYNQTLKSATYLSYSDFLDWQREAHSFERMAAFQQWDHDLTSPGTAEHLSGEQVSWGFFSTLGVKLALGREFTAQEDVHGGAPVVIISDTLWRNRFGQSPKAVGKIATLDGVDYTIIGVLPPGFRLLTDADFYLPLGQADPLALGDRATHDIASIGRLRAEVGIGQAQAEMNAVQENLDRLYPREERGLGAEILPLKHEIVGTVRGTLLLLLGAVAVLLLIACANVANLLLARAAARSREFAVRAALGASRMRIVRQSIAESALLSVAGGILGLAVARWGVSGLLAALPGTLPRSENVELNTSVLLFAFGVSICVAMLSGLLPALKSSSLDPQAALKQGGRGGTSAVHRIQRSFVVAQVALTLVLLAGAGLLFRTVRHLWSVNPGFDTHHVITFKIGLSPSVAKTPARMRIAYQQLMEHIREIPGVQAAEVTTLVPLSGEDDSLPFWLGPQAPPSMAEAPRALSYSVGPDYLRVMGIPLLRGRFFTLHDTTHSAPVVVIDSQMARAYFPGKDPVGQKISFIHVGQFRVIGVAGHVRHWGLDNRGGLSPYQVYSSFYEISDQWLPVMYPSVTATIRTELDPAAIMRPIKAAVFKAGADQPIYSVRTIQQLASHSMHQRLPMILMGMFAGMALVLACIGTYGVISYSVEQRVQEIGIRMALGAEKADVSRLVIAEGLRLALAGVVIGGAAALMLARFLLSFSTLLYGVGASDPTTFASVSLVLTGVAAGACYIPARRAARLDPMAALRHE